MKTFAVAILTVVVACLPVRGQDKKNADKILGTWEATKGEIPAGATLAFNKDGKLKVMAEVDGKAVNIEGTYKVDGDTLTTTTKHEGADRTETATIKTLTDKELVLENKKGKTFEFKKK